MASADQSIPNELPMIPVKGRVLLPGSAIKLTIGRTKSVSLVENLWDGKSRFNSRNILVAIFTQKDAEANEALTLSHGAENGLNLYQVGTVGRVVQLSRSGIDRYNMLIQGVCRIRLKSIAQRIPFYRMEGEILKDVGSEDDPVSRALAVKVRKAAEEILESQQSPRNGKPVKLGSSTKNFLNTLRQLSLGQLADVLTGTIGGEVDEKYEVLKATDIRERLEKALALVQKQLETLKISKKIQSQVEGSLKSSQREYILRQQLKAIQKELGEGGGEEDSDEINHLKERLEALPLPPDARKTVTRELKRLARMQPVQPEYSVIQSYLEWMVELPWGKYSPDNVDVLRVKHQLDQDHFGLEKVKRRLVEFLAIKQLHDMKQGMGQNEIIEATENVQVGDSEGGDIEAAIGRDEEPNGSTPAIADKRKKGRTAGAILCLVGPPGVGKTSLGNSVAKALGRTFHRMALGGVRDEAELRGHRRTYIGAMPGNIIAGMKKAGTQNPVILLDEVDKLGRDNRGDPASALLEILDPEQNEHFVDHYLNTEFDLSEVLFFATANNLADIPGPLRDRMEIIQIPGYTTLEKVKIAENHLIPRAAQRHALDFNDFKMPTAAVHFLIRNYTREAGVRGLERELSSLCRAIAVQYAEWMGANRDMEGSAFRAPIVNERFVEEVLGPVRYLSEAAMRVTVPGVATGLAWTAVGGELLFIESTRYRGNGQLTLTGQLGSVMKESASTALSWIRANVIELGLQEPALLHDQVPLLKYYDVHLHFPAGAVPKDGPSAGVAITSALVSLFLGKRVRSDTAMTGEVTLQGKVLPVGGIKEKSLAAHREGIRRLILPKKNRKDLTDIPKEIQKEMKIIFVERIEQALDAVIEGGVEFGTDESKRALPASLERTINTRAQNIAAKHLLMSNL